MGFPLDSTSRAIVIRAELEPTTFPAGAILAAKGKTFHWASKLLGARFRERATRLYAFCRLVDDLADESGPPEAARRALSDCRMAIRSDIYSHPICGDMVDLISECRIDRGVVLELIDGIAGDLEPVRIETTEALLHYCYQVAGTVGIMMCGIFEVRDLAAQAYAIDLGVAMQLTNLCRDVADDAVAGRRYLPATLVGDLNPLELILPVERLRPRLCDGIKSLLRLADTYYSSGERGLPYLPLEARVAILVAAQLYRAIGTKLLNQHGNYWSRRVAVSPTAKRVLSASVLVSRSFAPGFWVVPREHDARLHLAFADRPLLSSTRVAALDS
jgi:phytoene synthase